MLGILQGLVTLGVLFAIAYVVDAKIGKERFERHERFSRQIDIEVLEYVIADYELKEGIEEDE